MAPPAGPATPTTNHDPPVALIFTGAAGEPNDKETAADRSGSVAVGRTSSLTEETVPVEAELGLPIMPLPNATAGLNHASPLAVFVRDFAVDSANGEQLIHKDLMPRGEFIFHLILCLLIDFNRIAF